MFLLPDSHFAPPREQNPADLRPDEVSPLLRAGRNGRRGLGAEPPVDKQRLCRCTPTISTKKAPHGASLVEVVGFKS